MGEFMKYWLGNIRIFGSVLAIGALLALGAAVGSPTASAERCTNLINYAGDPRSNAEINSIGAVSGRCPTPLTGSSGASNSIPGVTMGVVAGQPCSNTERYIFGVSTTGQPMACGHGLDGGGIWGPAIALVGVRPLGSPCTEAGLAAQSPDGLPMVCGSGRWVVNAA